MHANHLALIAGLTLTSLSAAQNANPLARDRGPVSQTYLAGTVTTFLDQPSFAGAAGATTLIDFESFADGTEINTELAPFGIANVTGTSDFEVPPGPTTQYVNSSATLPFPMFIAGTLPTETNYFSNRIDFPGPAGTGTILLEFSGPATAVGAFFADQSAIGDQLIEIFDQDGVSMGTAVRPGGGNLPNSFLGLTSTTPFFSAQFRSANNADSWGLDNLEFASNTVGTAFCTSTTNSTGSAAGISASGSTSVAANDLTLESGLVPNQPGLFYYGPTQTLLPFGDGFRCVGGTVVRLNPPTQTAGNTATRVVDVLNEGFVGGQTVNFQYWFRDPAAGGTGFNLSTGLEITFAP